jgi:hypothetical protein
MQVVIGFTPLHHQALSLLLLLSQTQSFLSSQVVDQVVSIRVQVVEQVDIAAQS